jgi:hypothetical protein
MPGNGLIIVLVSDVAHDEDQVEARQHRGLQVDVLGRGAQVVVPAGVGFRV